jgi:hypothetical protein
MTEGPGSPVPVSLGIAAFTGAIGLGLLLHSSRKLAPDLILLGGILFSLLVTFDEIAVAYKTPLIVVCTLILTFGALGYHRSRALWLRWLFLVSAATFSLAVASLAADRFWIWVSAQGYAGCYPRCFPAADPGNVWWKLFLPF